MPELNREIIFMLELKQEKPFVCSYASKALNIWNHKNFSSDFSSEFTVANLQEGSFKFQMFSFVKMMSCYKNLGLWRPNYQRTTKKLLLMSTHLLWQFIVFIKCQKNKIKNNVHCWSVINMMEEFFFTCGKWL